MGKSEVYIVVYKLSFSTMYDCASLLADFVTLRFYFLKKNVITNREKNYFNITNCFIPPLLGTENVFIRCC